MDLLVIGGGPAGLMAAEAATAAGARVTVCDAMPTVGRKFLLAGIGGLNLTHAEDSAAFISRYGAESNHVQPWLARFGPQDLRDWAAGLGVETFVGSSRRVFPVSMKAAPLLRAWLSRLRAQGVQWRMRHRWRGWAPDGAWRFDTPAGEQSLRPRAVVLALGGGSWPQLGSDGAWVALLRAQGVEVAPLRSSNCGFDVGPLPPQEGRLGWSDYFRERHAGTPLKALRLHVGEWQQRGEAVITANGLEGSVVYAASRTIRETLERQGRCTIELDLCPERSAQAVLDAVQHPRGARSLASHLRSRLGLPPVALALVHEALGPSAAQDVRQLGLALKRLPMPVAQARPLAEAISTAGGVAWEALDERLMLRRHPGVFCAGEMLDWDAPTGGYLLTASMASGRVAGEAAAAWLNASPPGLRASAASQALGPVGNAEAVRLR